MGVYIDNSKHLLGRMVMSHMIADTLEELLAMVDCLGISRGHIQDAGTPREHFDVCQSKKALALQSGAEAITSHELVRKLRARGAAIPVQERLL
jgi:signal recognition particle subunit SEC65